VDDVLAAAGLDQRGKLALVGSPYPSVADLLADVRAGIVGEVVDAHPTVRDEAAYDAVVAAARQAVADRTTTAVHDVMRVLEAWRTTDKAISGRADLMTLPALTDMRAQVARLMATGFIGEAGPSRLRDLGRYLAAVTHRRARLDAQVVRDRQLMDQLSGLQEAWLHAVAALPDGQPMPQHLREARWLLEEYRVSLFAQQLGTATKVSDQRIRKVLGTAAG
jgi:ATP-dependent helicase HrpA